MTGKLIYMFTYRKNRFNNLFWLLTLITLISCGEGYEKVEGQWTWVLHSEAGKHMREIEIDNGTFEILDNKSYAKDKSSVFWRGVRIDKADPKTFKVISDNGYSKDKNYVFLDNDIVIFANPETFKVIDWPYSMDNERLFNGQLKFKDNDEDNLTSQRYVSVLGGYNQVLKQNKVPGNLRLRANLNSSLNFDNENSFSRPPSSAQLGLNYYQPNTLGPINSTTNFKSAIVEESI